MDDNRTKHHQNRNFCNLLCEGIDHGSVDSVRTALIDNKDDLNEKNPCGYIPLHFAIQRGCNAEVVKLLVDAGADVNLKNSEGNTSIHMAFDVTDEEIIKLLCDCGADVSIENNEGSTAMEVCIYSDDFKCSVNMAKMFFDAGGDVNRKTIDGETLLHLAAAGCEEDLVRYLISLGLDVNARDDCGQTPLLSVAESDCFDMRQLRQDYMSSLGPMDEMFGVFNTIKLLLMSGADANAVNNKGETLLHALARESDEKLIELLLNQMKKFYTKKIE